MCDATRNIANVIVPSMDMSFPIDRYYRRDVRLLFLLGLWPNQSLLGKIFRNVIVNVTLIVGFFFYIYQCYTWHFETKLNVEDLQFFMLFLCCFMSYYNIILRFPQVKKIRDHIVLDWEQLSNEDEMLIMRKYADESENYTFFVIIIFYTFAAFLVFPSVFHFLLYALRLTNEAQLTLPLPIRFFFNVDKHFYIVLIVECFVIWIICTLTVAIFSTYMLLIIHACALLSLVTFKVDQSFRKVSKEVPYDWSSSVKQDAYEWIKEIVKRYENATGFIDMINAITEKLYFIEVALGTVLIIIELFYLCQCLQMMQSTSFIKYTYEIFVCSIYIGGSTFTLYLNCYMGQKLIDHGTEVLESFNRVSLYELPPNCQKVLPLLIMRSAKPCVVSIGGLFVASHDFFAQFMNTSLSYAMVCYNIH